MTIHSMVRSLGAVALTATTAVALAACAAGSTTLPAPPTRVPSATATPSAVRTPSAAPARTGTTQASPSTGTTQASPSTGTTAGTSGTSAAAGPGAGTRSGACSFDHLSMSIEGQDGGARGVKDTMNTINVSVVLHNTGASSCTVQGWPGVSYVGRGNGTQVGGAATLTRTVPHPTVTLRPGGTAQAHLTASALPESCTTAPVDGLRVYPPGSKRSFFSDTRLVTTGGVCADASVSLLRVEAFIPNP